MTSSNPFPPALAPTEWAGIIAKQDQLDELREGLLDTPFSPHGIAALMLWQQPFGFTFQDVIDEVEVAAYCDKMSGEHQTMGNAGIAETFRLLGFRHRERAAKIAALLPPTEMLRETEPPPPSAPPGSPPVS